MGRWLLPLFGANVILLALGQATVDSSTIIPFSPRAGFEFAIEVIGTGFDKINDKILIIPYGLNCGDPAGFPPAGGLASVADYEALSCAEPGSAPTKLSCKGLSVFQPGVYTVCVCDSDSPGRVSAASTTAAAGSASTTDTSTTTTLPSGCSTPERFWLGSSSTGSLTIYGAGYFGSLQWRAGASDQIVISGDMLSSRDRIRIVDGRTTCTAVSESKAMDPGVSVTSPFNPPVGPRDTMGGSDTSEMWSGIGIMVPGTYQVCWCGDGLGDCDSNEDFIVWAGTIVVSGPTPGVVQEHKCIAGVTCTVQMTGSGLSDFDRIRIISGWQECGYASMTSDVLQGAAGKRSSGDASISRYGGVILGRQGLFKVCWCGSKTASCATEDFNMYVGNLTVGGPQQGRVDNPPIGMPFSYAVEGWGLSDTDRIRIVNADVRCASSDAATMSPGVEAESALFGPPTTVSGPEPTNRTSVRWSNILITQMAEYRVCWCARFTGGCQTGANFALDIGMISPRGAANTTKIAAIPGRPFALVVKAMPGSTLSITDRMRIVDRQLSRGECGVSGTSTHAPAVSALVCWPTCVNSSRNSAPRLGPGNASETWDPILIMDNGLFDICWCSSGLGGCDSDADFSYKVGEIVSAGVSVGHKWSCAAYLPCFLEVPITGGVTVDDMVQLVPAGNSVKCGSTQQSDGSSFTRGTRVTGFKSVNSAGASVMVFEFGNPQGTGIFQACYCQGPVCRQPQVSDMDFFQRAGEVTVSGIQDNDAYHKCYLRGDCPLVIKGTGLRAQDAVMLYDIQDSCGQSGDPVDFSSDGPTFYTSAGDRMFIGALAGVTNDGVESWKFDLGSPNLVGRKRLCYCSQSRAGGGMCRYRADFDQPAGEIYVRGSEFNAEVRCNQGEPCRITVRGHAFDRSDRILLLKDGPNRTCGMANPDYWASWMSPTTPEGVNPDIIIPDLWAATYNLISVREPGSYLVCYCAYIFGSETCVAPTAALPPYQRYPHQIGSLRVTGSILALRKVGSTPQSALPAAPFAASVEVDAMNSGLKFTCVATSRAAPDGFIPMKSDLLNCSMDVMVLSERQKLMPRCWGISTTPSAVPAIGPNLVHVPLFMSADALKTTVNLHVWCFGSAMCSNDRCVMPADSEGLSLPLTSGLQTTTAVWSATVGTPFGLRVQLGSDFDLGAEWPRVKIISSGEACDRTLLHSSVSGLACVASGVGKCEPGPSASLSTVSWGAGREIVWDNVKVSKADAYDVCYCDRHYDLTCVAWQRIGILVVKGPLNAGSYQYWGNPGEQFQISLQGSGLAVADRLRVVKQAARCTDQFDGYSANNLAPTTVPPTLATTTSTAPNSSNGTGSRRLQLNTDWRSGSAAFANGSVANFYGQIDGIGDYRVCWCGGAGRSCQQPAEFTVDLGTLKVAVKKACVVTAWWVVKQCNVECGGGQVSSRRGITSQAEGGGTPCPSEQELYKLEQCNMEPCPLARVDVAFTEPAKVFAGGAGFQINVEGDWLDPAADRVVLIAEGDRCGKTEVHFGGASCAQDGATGRRLVCGDGITSIRVAKAGRYRLCVCDASGAFVRSADGTQNISTGSFEAAGITGMGCATPNLYTLEPSVGSVLVIEEYVPASATSTKDEALSAAAIAGVTGAVGLILLTAGMGTCWWVRKRSKAHAQKVMDEAAAEQQAAAQKAQGTGGMDPQMLQWYESYYQSLGYPPGTATQAFGGAAAVAPQLALPSYMPEAPAPIQQPTWLALQNGPRPPSNVPLALPPMRPPGKLAPRPGSGGRSPRDSGGASNFGDLVSDVIKRPSLSLPMFTETALSTFPTPTATPRDSLTPREGENQLALEDGSQLRIPDSMAMTGSSMGSSYMGDRPLTADSMMSHYGDRPQTGDSIYSGRSLAYSESSSRPSTGGDLTPQSAMSPEAPFAMSPETLSPVKEEEDEQPSKVTPRSFRSFFNQRIDNLVKGSEREDAGETEPKSATPQKSRMSLLWGSKPTPPPARTADAPEPPREDPVPTLPLGPSQDEVLPVEAALAPPPAPPTPQAPPEPPEVDDREVKERAQREAEVSRAAERASREAEEKAKMEEETRMKMEAEERETQQRAQREAEERKAADSARREAEERKTREAEEKANRDAEERTNREVQERVKREAEERVKRDAEESAKKQAEEAAEREAEEEAEREAEEQRLAEEKAQRAQKMKGLWSAEGMAALVGAGVPPKDATEPPAAPGGAWAGPLTPTLGGSPPRPLLPQEPTAPESPAAESRPVTPPMLGRKPPPPPPGRPQTAQGASEPAPVPPRDGAWDASGDDQGARPPPPPPGSKPPPRKQLSVETDAESALALTDLAIPSPSGRRVPATLGDMLRSQQGLNRAGEEKPPSTPGTDTEQAESPTSGAVTSPSGKPPPPPPGKPPLRPGTQLALPGPGPAMDDLLDTSFGSTHSLASGMSGSPSGNRKKISLGSLAKSSADVVAKDNEARTQTPDSPAAKSSPVINLSQPKRPAQAVPTRQVFDRPAEQVAPPPIPPGSPNAAKRPPTPS